MAIHPHLLRFLCRPRVEHMYDLASRRVLFSHQDALLCTVVTQFKLDEGTQRLILLVFARPVLLATPHLLPHSTKAGAATMDNDTVQLQNLPAESTDIFSLTDQVLSERLEFLEEVRWPCTRSLG